MKKNKLLSIIIVCLLAVLVVASILYFHFFSEKDDATNIYDILKDAPRKDYNLTLMTAGNMMLSDIDVFVYFDSSFEKLIDYSKTDKNGSVTFTLAEYDNYAIVLSGIPKGYKVEDHYSFEGDNTSITFSSQLISDENIYDAKFSVGNIMYDWTVTLCDGNDVTISDILSRKKMLVINFWYEGSSSSVDQLKIFNDLYSKYEDSVEIIALNAVDKPEQIKTFKEDNSLTFNIASCSRRISATFGVSRCPTTIIIDRYGVISMLEVGAVSSEKQLSTVFDHFVKNDYVQQIFRGGMTEFVSELFPAPTVFEVVAKDRENLKIAGVEITLTTDDAVYTEITDESGVATFEVTTQENDILTVLNYPEGYEYKGASEITLYDGMFMYNVIFENLNDDKK